jgi:epsilon-lactone hydrolase
MLNVESLKAKADNYAGNADPRSPLISPLYADLSGLSPLLIHVGSDELLFQDSVRIAKKAENAGVSVSLKIYDHLWHVFHLNAKLMPESKSALADFGSFITEHFGN